jgi:hypothetical protein
MLEAVTPMNDFIIIIKDKGSPPVALKFNAVVKALNDLGYVVTKTDLKL